MNDPQFTGVMSLSSINKVRKQNGLKPIKKQKRNCLRCGKEFLSWGPNQRMCGCVKDTNVNEWNSKEDGYGKKLDQERS
jgi:hypothetical protein